MIRNISTGDENELYRYSSDNFYDRVFTLSLSPDGKWLSAINIGENKVVRLISTIDGKTRDLYTCKTIGTTEYDQVWSRDGRYIIITYPKQLENGGNEWNLMILPFEGGENLSIKTNMLGMFHPTLHPDGRNLSFESTGFSKPENNIWEMKNFLPK
jgi:Tol biopolymer transport system component